MRKASIAGLALALLMAGAAPGRRPEEPNPAQRAAIEKMKTAQDAQQADEVVAEVQRHRKDPPALGAADLVVFDVHEDTIGWRGGATRQFAQAPRPPLPPKLTIPAPRQLIEEVYPEGYHPELVKEWPLTGSITISAPEATIDPK